MFLHTQRRGGGHSICPSQTIIPDCTSLCLSAPFLILHPFFSSRLPWSSFPPPASTIKGVAIVAVPIHDECGAHRKDRCSARHSSSLNIPWVSGKDSAVPSETHVLHGTEVTGHNGGSQDLLFLKVQLSEAVALWVILAAVAHTKTNREFF